MARRQMQIVVSILHVRFTDAELFKLFSYWQVYSVFIGKYKKDFGSVKKYQNRLDNSYSHDYSGNDELVKGYEGASGKYWAINFGSIHEHNTLEFRLFPHQDSAEEAKNTMSWIVELFE